MLNFKYLCVLDNSAKTNVKFLLNHYCFVHFLKTF